MGMTGTPIYILREGTQRTRGKDALRNNISAAKVIAEAVKSALGPKGMDKMLVDPQGDVIITNDGATILKEIDVNHPGAKFIIDLAKTQDQEVGDGTSTVVILAGELLKTAEELIESNIHPSIIVEGYRLAKEESIKLLNNIVIKPTEQNLKKKLIDIAKTSISSKIISGNKDFISELLVNAVLDIYKGEKIDLDDILIVKRVGGVFKETELISGIILEKEKTDEDMPNLVENAKILLLSTALETQKTQFEAKFNITNIEQVNQFKEQENKALSDIAAKIIESGANVVICQKKIVDNIKSILAKNNIMVLHNIDKNDIDNLSKCTGASIIQNVSDISIEDLGSAGKIEQKTIAGETMVMIEDTPEHDVVSILIRAGTDFVLEEYERSIHDALCVIRDVLEDRRLVPGGGSPEMYIANELRDFKMGQPPKIQLAIEAFAHAMEIIPTVLAQNAGLDPIDIIGKLNQKYKEEKYTYGIDPERSEIADMKKQGVLEPLRVKTQAIESASEAATMLLRIDDVVAAKGAMGYSDED